MANIDEDARNGIAHIKQPRVAMWLSVQVIDALDAIKGYESVPPDVQRRIAEVCASFYGAGYIHGMEVRP